MCIAELNRSTSPCGHTYFRLTRACSSETSLVNCAKLSLSGWEQKTDSCAVCGGSAIGDPTNYRIFGYDDPSGMGVNLSRTNSLSTLTTTSLASARRDSRRGSLARSDSSTGSMAQLAATAASTSSPVSPTYSTPLAPMNQYMAEKNISQTQRIDAYLAQLPENIARGIQVSTGEDKGSVCRSRAGSKSSTGGGGSGSGGGGGGELSSDGDKSGVVMRWGQKGRRLAKFF